MKKNRFRLKSIFVYFGFLFLISVFMGGCLGGGGSKGPKLTNSNPRQILYEYTLKLDVPAIYSSWGELDGLLRKVSKMVGTTVNLDVKGRFHFLKGILLYRKAFLAQFNFKYCAQSLSFVEDSLKSLERFKELSSPKKEVEILANFFLAKVLRLKGKLEKNNNEIYQSIFTFKKLYYALANEDENYYFSLWKIDKYHVGLELVKTYLEGGYYDLAEDTLQKLSVDKYLKEPLYLETLADLRLAEGKWEEAQRVLENFTQREYEDYYNRSYNLYRLLGIYNIRILKLEKNYKLNRERIVKLLGKENYFISKDVEEFHGIYLYKSEVKKDYQTLWNIFKENKDFTQLKLENNSLVSALKSYLSFLKEKNYFLKRKLGLRLKPSKSILLLWSSQIKNQLKLWFYLKSAGKRYLLQWKDKVVGFLNPDESSISSLNIELNKIISQSSSQRKVNLSVVNPDTKKSVYQLEIPLDNL